MKDFEAIYRAEGRYHHQLAGFPLWWTRENYRILSGWIETGERVLDLACGDGGFWPFVQAAEIIGADHAPTALKLAREVSRNSVVRANMTALPFKTGSFDAVACSLSLQYLPMGELGECLSEVVRILREHGRFLFSYPNIRPGHRADPAHAAIPRESLEEQLERAGFRRLDVRSISPRLPARLFRWSFKPGLKLISFVYYRAARTLGRNASRSYHYAILCASPGFEPKGDVS